jgi:hypothetical protein
VVKWCIGVGFIGMGNVLVMLCVCYDRVEGCALVV